MLNVISFQHIIIRVIEKIVASCSLSARQRDFVFCSPECRTFCLDPPGCFSIPRPSPHARTTLAFMPSRSFDQLSRSEPI
jgi:hypothetical protein